MKEVSTLIFSKDRGAQLELLLSTMQEFMASPVEATILYTTTWPESEQCYTVLKDMFPEHIFIREELPIQEHIKGFINAQEAPYTLLMCDDEVMYRPFDLASVLPFMSEVLSCSLRLGTNVNFNFPANRMQKLPTGIEFLTDDLMRWQWNTPDAEFDFAYPMSVTDNLFHTSFLKDALTKIPFKSVNSLEGNLDMYKKLLTKPGPQSWMMSPRTSVFYSLPFNLVQKEYLWNRTTDIKLSTEDAVTNFLSGKRLKIYQGNVNACHCNFQYEFTTQE